MDERFLDALGDMNFVRRHFRAINEVSAQIEFLKHFRSCCSHTVSPHHEPRDPAATVRRFCRFVIGKNIEDMGQLRGVERERLEVVLSAFLEGKADARTQEGRLAQILRLACEGNHRSEAREQLARFLRQSWNWVMLGRSVEPTAIIDRWIDELTERKQQLRSLQQAPPEIPAPAPSVAEAAPLTDLERGVLQVLYELQPLVGHTAKEIATALTPLGGGGVSDKKVRDKLIQKLKERGFEIPNHRGGRGYYLSEQDRERAARTFDP